MQLSVVHVQLVPIPPVKGMLPVWFVYLDNFRIKPIKPAATLVQLELSLLNRLQPAVLLAHLVPTLPLVNRFARIVLLAIIRIPLLVCV